MIHLGIDNGLVMMLLY